MSAKRIYIVVGEASGDLHASNFMRALLELRPEIDFRFWGGDRMAEVKPNGLVKHIRELAFMGFTEVLLNIRTILGNIGRCKEDILAYKPDALVLVDYPGFNLRIAEWAHGCGIPVHYYISPQIWAWKQSRVHKIKRVVDHMYVILPFEPEFYARFGMKVHFVGHPLIDAISRYQENAVANDSIFRAANGLGDKPIIALLPGSRKQEIASKLPIMRAATDHLSDFKIVVAGAPAIDQDYYATFLDAKTTVLYGKTYDLLAHASYALVTSGTATLETALFKVPQVVCYKGSPISYQIAKRLVKVPYISLVNLIMNKQVVKELIQYDCTPANVRSELELIMQDEKTRSRMLADYDALIQILGTGGASKKVAQYLLKTID